MITRAQAEALLTLAESLETCERLGVTIKPDRDGDQGIYLNGTEVHNILAPTFTSVQIRYAVNNLVPKHTGS